MKKNGYTVIELLAVIIIIGAGFLLTITSVSYAFSDKKTEAYETEINYFLEMAKLYGEEVKNDIGDSTYGITITVANLIEKGFISANGDGTIKDPRNENLTLNDLRIKIYLDNDELKTEVVE